MKKIVSLIVVITLFLMTLTACVSNVDDVGVIGEFNGNAEICVYSDASLTQSHDGKLEVGTMYYVTINVDIDKKQGVALDKVSSILKIEFPTTETAIVAFNSGKAMEASTTSDHVTYSCNVYSDSTNTFVFSLMPIKSDAFNIRVLVDDKSIGNKIIDF